MDEWLVVLYGSRMPMTTSRAQCFLKILMGWKAFLTAIPVEGQMVFSAESAPADCSLSVCRVSLTANQRKKQYLKDKCGTASDYRLKNTSSSCCLKRQFTKVTKTYFLAYFYSLSEKSDGIPYFSCCDHVPWADTNTGCLSWRHFVSQSDVSSSSVSWNTSVSHIVALTCSFITTNKHTLTVHWL